jgi:two-component system, chemotaxis family, protein-glutamate methylesterase/glutaminase
VFCKFVDMGSSLGGLSALQTVLAHLPANFILSIAIVLYRHKNSDLTLQRLLQKNLCCRCKRWKIKTKLSPEMFI